MIKIGNDWDNVLKEEIQKPYFVALMQKVKEEYANKKVFPPFEFIFRALQMTAYNDVKVFILGQDPYHGEGQANGLAFAVNDGIALPPSLVNIFKEIESDMGYKMPANGTLLGWEQQGVMLLNTSLTVRKSEPQSHAAMGWQQFTDAVVRALAKRAQPLVFMLWGSNAISKKNLISGSHLVLTAPHPSPLSVYRGFTGCKHFSKTNRFLVQNGQPEIQWSRVDGFDDGYFGKKGKIMRALPLAEKKDTKKDA